MFAGPIYIYSSTSVGDTVSPGPCQLEAGPHQIRVAWTQTNSITSTNARLGPTKIRPDGYKPILGWAY